MIPIREHNDIVEKLMKEISAKDRELNAVIKEKTKAPSQVPQLQPTKNEEVLTKKINQLSKEYKDRIGALTQQIRNKSLQNKELKERLTTKQNIQAKQKEHIAEILKKTYDRKPSSGADYKISALVAHYQGEIDRKNKFIETLKKKNSELEADSLKETSEPIPNENYKVANESEQNKGISFTQHQKELSKVRMDLQKYKKLFEEKEKEYKDLARRYSELTNEYYKIINAYGIEEQIVRPKTATTIPSPKQVMSTLKQIKPASKNNALQNLLQQMVCSESQVEEATVNKRGFSHKVATIQAQGCNLKQQFQEGDNQLQEEESLSVEPNKENYDSEETAASRKLEQVMECLQISDANEIIPLLIKIKTNLEEYNLVDTVARSLQVFFCNIGKGKLTKKQLVSALEDLQIVYNKNLQAVDILDQLCIDVGAKRAKLKEKIAQLVSSQNEYMNKLKSLKFMQEVAKGNKIVEFIEFFELDKEQLALPQQLKKIHDQLKAIDKFIKESRLILQIGAESSSQQVLALILRYLQKTTSLVSQLDKKSSKKKMKEQRES